MRLFVYATLKAAGIQRAAMGHVATLETKAFVMGFKESALHWDGQDWPTLIPAGKEDLVAGELLDVGAAELKRLDKWEEHYRRIHLEVRPSGLVAYAYLIDPTKLRRTE